MLLKPISNAVLLSGLSSYQVVLIPVIGKEPPNFKTEIIRHFEKEGTPHRRIIK